jgi:hypothetical protein
MFYRNEKKHMNFDPIDLDSIDVTEDWVMDEDEPPLLDAEEINRMLEEDARPIYTNRTGTL